MINLGYNWEQSYSIKSAERDLVGFKYKGDGWYITKTDTLFVKGLGDGRIRVICWNTPNGRDLVISEFASVLGAYVYKED